MKRITGFFNESIDLIPKEAKYIIGVSYEDRNMEWLESKFYELEFIFDNTCNDKFIAINTGSYIYNETTKKEYYDNYQNMIILINKEVWNEYKDRVYANEKRIREEYDVPLPEWLIKELNETTSPIVKEEDFSEYKPSLIDVKAFGEWLLKLPEYDLVHNRYNGYEYVKEYKSIRKLFTEFYKQKLKL